jgi:hypothetical protein
MLREATRIRYYSHPSSPFLSFGVGMVVGIYTKIMEAAQESIREELKEISVFCETRSKRCVEVYKGKNLHPPPTDVTDTCSFDLVTDRDRHRGNGSSQTL